MAYAAVISAMQTIERLLNSSRILLSPPSLNIVKSANQELKSLKETLKKLDGGSKNVSWKKVNALDARIREAVSQFEDLLESVVLDQIVSQSESDASSNFSIDLQHLTQDVDFFMDLMKRMEEDYNLELQKPLTDEEDYDDIDTVPDLGEKRSKMVGLSEEFSKMKDFLTNSSDDQHYVISIVEMAGMGKTTFAMELFQDPSVVSHFEHRAWVTVGRKYELDELARQLLIQVDPDTNLLLLEGSADKARYNLYRKLKDSRYLIVLDDVWDTQVWDYLSCSLPYSAGRSRVLLTTRIKDVARHIYHPAFFNHKTIGLLSREESWILLSQKVFGEKRCPPQLQKAGKEIAANCFGLPLVIVTAAELLSKVEMTPESWKKVAEEQDFVFMDNDAHERISKVLMPSYEYLPQYLKPCFLLMGVVPQKHEIPFFMFRDIWILEGFLEPNIKVKQTMKDCARQYLANLVSNSLVMPHKSNETYPSTDKDIKTCLIHTSVWHFCKREAGKNKFFHVLRTLDDGLDEGIKNQRRLVVHNNILFGVKDVYDSIEDNCASTARSLQCYGRYHEYQVPICSGLRFLRILDVRRIRFYKFPMAVLKMIQLRYFSLTYNGKLPPSISKLWNLEFLIVHRHGSIKSGGAAQSHEPVEIWDMQEMKHLRIMGSRLPNPNCGSSLKNLLTLLGVNAGICSKRILKRISKLKKLAIRIELAPRDGSRPFNGLNRISRLRRLESLQCIVVNPEVRPEFFAPPPPRSMFPSTLRKLRLIGLGYPWEHMNIIGSLPNLEVLKLRCYAFQGPKCEIQRKKFLKLRFLFIEDTDLVELNIASESLPELSTLSFKHCYKVEAVRWESGIYGGKIEAPLCNPMIERCLKELKEAREKRNASLMAGVSAMPVVDADGNVHMIRYIIDEHGNFKIIISEEMAAALANP
ncbi:hypothetical protein C2S51_003490 [Perilla frutescens var. frutescens]|nr:hypothetical protein C2S51_003490 [Perilla frutescens var. frutescens]